MEENIFLDTSIFVQENFLHSKRIQQFLELCSDGKIRLILTIITINEIKSQFKKRAHTAVEIHNGLIKNRDLWVLKNSSESNRLEKFTKPDIITDQFNKQLDEALVKANAKIIDYPVINTKVVFDKYFNGAFPFNKGDKKHEFPDAIALYAIEEWCTAKGKRCILFSKDKDFLKSKMQPGITVQKNFEVFMDQLLKRFNPERMSLVQQIYTDNSVHLDAELSKWIREELDDVSIYTDFTDYYEVHDIEVPLIEVVEKTYTILQVGEEMIDIEVVANVNIKIVLTIDDSETGFYDSEEGEVLFRETTELPIEQELEITFVVSFYIVDKDDYDTMVEVTEFNNGQSIKLENHNRNIYY
ncbi:MAG: PIN domain-containing protein [Bacteroidota bacterium]